MLCLSIYFSKKNVLPAGPGKGGFTGIFLPVRRLACAGQGGYKTRLQKPAPAAVFFSL
jgi:hypothetical protein